MTDTDAWADLLQLRPDELDEFTHWKTRRSNPTTDRPPTAERLLRPTQEETPMTDDTAQTLMALAQQGLDLIADIEATDTPETR